MGGTASDAASFLVDDDDGASGSSEGSASSSPSESTPHADAAGSSAGGRRDRAGDELISLDLSQVGAGPAGFYRLFTTLQTNSTLTNLVLANRAGVPRNRGLNHPFLLAKGLCPYLAGPFCVLTSLDLYGAQLGNPGLAKLTAALVQNQSLLVLNLGFNSLTGSAAAEHICTLLRDCTNIVDLDISRNSFGNGGMTRVLSTLADAPPAVVRLNFAHTGLSVVSAAKATAAGSAQARAPRLKKVDLTGNVFTDQVTLSTLTELRRARQASARKPAGPGISQGSGPASRPGTPKGNAETGSRLSTSSRRQSAGSAAEALELILRGELGQAEAGSVVCTYLQRLLRLISFQQHL